MKTPDKKNLSGVATRQTPKRKLNRDQQIQAARRLLGPAAPRDGDDENGDIEFALVEIDYIYGRYALDKEQLSKKTKVALRTILSMLKRAEYASRPLPWPWCQYFDLKLYREECELLLAAPSGPPKRESYKQQLAAEGARSLLRRYGHNVTVTRKDRSGRKSKWLQLAAILYGDANADMFHHCCTILKRDRNRV